MAARKEISADEFRKRIRNADVVVNLGAAPLLVPTSLHFTDEEAERSLFRLLRSAVSKTSSKVE